MAGLLIDTHAHLQFDQFDADRDAVVARAREAGVGAIISLATDRPSCDRVIELAEKYDSVFAAVGIHPTEVGRARPQDYEALAELAAHPKVVAIGETGMDFYWEKATAPLQEQAFFFQLELAARLNLPVVIHNRQAGLSILRVLDGAGALPLRGVFHCFCEDSNYAQEVIRRGFHISFTGNITYKNSGLDRVSAVVPLERLLLETDSPFLAPVPCRGKRNEPAWVKFIAEKHAEVRGLSCDEVGRATTANAVRLFNLPGESKKFQANAQQKGEHMAR